jgi:hypothetical protein
MAIVRRHKQDHFDEKSVDTDDFMTTSQMFQKKSPLVDEASPNRANFKKKTQFSHFYNAYCLNGVFFNPPSVAV